MSDKIVLAYSGGLDTSVAIAWLKESYGYEVIALTADVGEGKDLQAIRNKALAVGAQKAYVVDAKERFANEFVLPALYANALYEGAYPLSSALSRPLIARLLTEVAVREQAQAVAHGCTGKGNDQVRFDVSVGALRPELKIVAPVREWAMSREEEIGYAETHGIPVPVTKADPFSVDVNLWGRSCEAGVLEDPWLEPPPQAYAWTADLAETPDQPTYVTITFEAGRPVALDGESLPLWQLIQKLNALAGTHGIGRIDHIENRLVGIKSREVYEAPAAVTLIAAHQALEAMTLPRELAHAKPAIEYQFANAAYEGLWYSPLMEAIMAYLQATQRSVWGEVRMKLFKGQAVVVGRRSQRSLYDYHLATYSPESAFDQSAAEGFIQLWGMPTRVYARQNSDQSSEGVCVAVTTGAAEES